MNTVFDLSKIFNSKPFGMAQKEKGSLFLERFHYLTGIHYSQCLAYRKILDALQFDMSRSHLLEEYAFLPARLFKEYDLRSVDSLRIIKNMTSSGTTSQIPSRIPLDAVTASNQIKALTYIVSDFIGPKRLSMLIIDHDTSRTDRNQFSAREAGIRGFSIFGRDITYALDGDMAPKYQTIVDFAERHAEETVLIFGFTSVVWQNFLKKLEVQGLSGMFAKAILIHGGGWKKLIEQAVSNEEFLQKTTAVLGTTRVHNYYGMVEQAGSIFMECEQHYFHCSNLSEILIRDEKLITCPFGQSGLIEVCSLLPESYPGHAILTEDVGEIMGEDDCWCGRSGKYFKVHGRLEMSETRGCSDAQSS